MDNSPHVLFFYPIIKNIENRGGKVILTARDAFQVCELIRNFKLNAKVIGKHHGKNKIYKIVGLFYRAILLSFFIFRKKPCLALSHGSRSQIISAKILRIKSMLIADYEFAKLIPLFYPDYIIIPEVIPKKYFPIKEDRIMYYPGIKEFVYLSSYKPNEEYLYELGLERNKILIVIRPPAIEAHYHNQMSDVLFEEAMNVVINNPNTQILLLPRSKNQKNSIIISWSESYKTGKIYIPDHALDGLDLIWNSDLVISGGGTMNREAAAMGVPVYSIFKGKIGFVDKYLSDIGKLTLIEDTKDVKNKIKLLKRKKNLATIKSKNDTLYVILDNIFAHC